MPIDPRELEGRLRDAQDVDLGSLRLGDQCGEEPDGARTEDQQPLTRAHSRTLHGPVCVAARLDERADRGIERLRHTVERFDRQRHLLGEGSRPAVAHADLVPPRADVVPAIRAALA